MVSHKNVSFIYYNYYLKVTLFRGNKMEIKRTERLQNKLNSDSKPTSKPESTIEFIAKVEAFVQKINKSIEDSNAYLAKAKAEIQKLTLNYTTK